MWTPGVPDVRLLNDIVTRQPIRLPQAVRGRLLFGNHWSRRNERSRKTELTADARSIMPRISITPEWRLLDPRVDLEALGLYLDTVEQQLAFLRNQWRIRLAADLKDASNRTERNWLLHESGVRETLVTRSLQGGFIMSLWASYESGILEVADFLKAKKDLRLRLSDVRGRDWFDQARKYFRQRLGIPSPSRPRRLESPARVA